MRGLIPLLRFKKAGVAKMGHWRIKQSSQLSVMRRQRMMRLYWGTLPVLDIISAARHLQSSRPPFDGLFVCAATTLRGAAASIGRRPDPEIIELFPGPEFCGQPAWLFPATGPSLGWPGGISIL